ncbi:MAG TPA: molybdate ABC transporter substrate-binding protein [Methylocella sp.]|nr:molybdate ABC transporter substrate-binding protein [Methylocella sp.]
MPQGPKPPPLAIRRAFLICAAAAASFCLSAFGLIGDGARAAEAAKKGPVVFAAASLKNALDLAAAAWAGESGEAAVLVYGSSAILAKQIEQGAPADIFISADLQWMDYLDKARLIRAATRQNLLGNELVLIAPSDAGAELTIAPGFDLAGALKGGRLAVCTIASCPGGIYAQQALEALGIWGKVEGKLAQAENIRGALNLVSRGEAPFGIVYATDAKADPHVKVVDVFSESTHAPIIYPIAIVETSAHPDAAALAAYFSTPAAEKIWVEQGFKILNGKAN